MLIFLAGGSQPRLGLFFEHCLLEICARRA
jgi:hypothetical protein